HDAYHIVYRTGAERATIVWRADDHSDCRNAHLQERERRYWCGLHHAGSDARLGAARARSRHGDRTWYRQIHERVPGTCNTDTVRRIRPKGASTRSRWGNAAQAPLWQDRQSSGRARWLFLAFRLGAALMWRYLDQQTGCI